MVIYIDVLLVTNFLISYFLLLASAVLSEYTYNRKRVILSAVLGALSCLYIFVQSDNGLLNLLFRLSSLAVCSAVAFGFGDKRKNLIQTVCFLMLNMLLTGAVSLLALTSTAVYHNNMFFYFSINPVLLVFSSAVIYMLILIFELVKERVTPQKIYTADIYFGDFSITGLTAFYDSGFKLKDIVSNKDVIVVSFEKVKEKMPQGMCKNVSSFLNGSYSEVKDGFVPVFFSTLSGGGMMPAVKAEYILLNGRKLGNILVAFTENELSENVSVIFGTDIRKQL